MGGTSNTLFNSLTTFVSIFFIKLTLFLPLPVSRLIGSILGRFAFYVVPRIRKVGMENLDIAYGDSLSRAEKTRILKGSIDNAAMVAVEFSRITSLAKHSFDDHVTIKGYENLDVNSGCLFIGGHLGNWEWMAPVMGSNGHNAAEVVRPFDDPRIDKIIDGIRCSGNIRTIPKGDAGREIIKLLKDNWFVGLLIDQSPRHNAVPVTFFGAPCWATIGPAMIAFRSKTPIHPVALFREGPSQYTLEFFPRFEITRTDNLRQDLIDNTQRFQDSFEQIVRKYPEQWLWIHKRWKKRRRLDEEWQAKLEQDREKARDVDPAAS